uniref:Calpain catalytic domain-containing protein n=1 Tax=Panagrolaimus sp. JU765 TaxID=591449 RepID=A0AC34QKD3_9BILA
MSDEEYYEEEGGYGDDDDYADDGNDDNYGYDEEHVYEDDNEHQYGSGGAEDYDDQNDFEDHPEDGEGENADSEALEEQEFHDQDYADVDEFCDAAKTEEGETPEIDYQGLVRGALDGFGGGSMGDIIGQIGNITSGEGGLTNMLASGALATIASSLIAGAAHRFLNVNPETGQIIGAIAGNLIFHTGGQHNSLSDIGKLILDNLVSGKFRRDVVPFVPPRSGMPSFNLDFYAERQRCLNERRLFEDPEFPAQDSSLYFSQRPRQRIEWKRPSEITDDPQLIVSGQSRFDVVQGALGDCWLLAAAANLTLRDELFYRVVPPDQSFTENYAGIFHFQFWRYGHWVDVVIDDRLPTSDGELIYMHSDEQNEFWSALLEKAYAKLYGSYEALKGGSISEAMEDFTGGLVEYFDVKKVPKEHLLAIFVRGFQMGSLFGCSIDADPASFEAKTSTGLVRGHAYSVTGLQTVHGPYGETVLLRIRNPWGNEAEWNGAWSDDAPEWNYISPEQRHQMNFVQRNDGEFWMSFDDFYANFEEVENCNLGPDVMNEISQMTGVDAAREATEWTNFQVDGAWSSNVGTAGGCRNYIDSFPNNPQYGTWFTIPDGSVEHDGKCTIIAAVLQKYRRELRPEGLDSLPIGFLVYELETRLQQRLSREYFEMHKPVAKNPTFINLREVTARFRLPPGSYVIIPSTFEPNDDAEFLLRVYCSGEVKGQQIG